MPPIYIVLKMSSNLVEQPADWKTMNDKTRVVQVP
jgi:hypothetical protein